ncbi:MAG TPA: carbohydrate ABC transporter permease [Anaerolineae bacterium]|nr:carbohydrate ABC transporter permease [Anaerolineae bacterium]
MASDGMAAPRRRQARGFTLPRQLRGLMAVASITLFGLMVLFVYLMPLAYMGVTSLKDRVQISNISGPIWPVTPRTINYDGEDYPVYRVPTEQGMKEWALVERGREESGFVDPANPDAGIITWTGRWRTLEPVYVLKLTWENYPNGWNTINFLRLMRNTFVIAILGTIGTLFSSTAVAYGFSRFRIPYKNVIFIVLIATIILPTQVTLIPTYAFFRAIGWGGTWWPLIVPHFFANAYNVFLLRQYFLSIPRDIDEAAWIDGASPLRTLTAVIIPQSLPAITAVGLFHFFWAWSDFFAPLVYLSGREELQPLSVGLAVFANIYGTQPGLAMATALMTITLPVIVFFLAQRQFMQGIVITGVEK